MRYQISGKQIDIGEALQTHVKSEMDEMLSKYAGRPTEAVVIFSKSAHEFVCETVVHLSTGLTAQAKAHATEIYAAFDSSSGISCNQVFLVGSWNTPSKITQKETPR